MTEKIVVIFSLPNSPKKHTIRWDSDDKEAAVTSLYIRKPFLQGARQIRMTIEEVTE